MEICALGQLIEITADTLIATSALLVSLAALFLSVYFWKRSFRPIVTAMVKTHAAGSEGTLFDLEILNSGALPAKNIRLRAEQNNINQALGSDAGHENRIRWLSCFEPDNSIAILHNNGKIRCSFGLSRSNNAGFWKHKAQIPITIEYEGWFGKKYRQAQVIHIIDSDSFTGFLWD